MRYADVLLMYAEAVNELEGGVTGPNGAKAIEAFKQVRNRAFAFEDRSEKVDAYIAANTSKDDFFKILMNERKWEFGDENMRWKDLVRINIQKLFVMFSTNIMAWPLMLVVTILIMMKINLALYLYSYFGKLYLIRIMWICIRTRR